jgi:hypothetical protein
MSDPVQKVVSWKADFALDGDLTRELVKLADSALKKFAGVTPDIRPAAPAVDAAPRDALLQKLD